MGKIGEALLGAAGGGVMSAAGGLIGGALGMIGRKKREERQLQQQMKLNEAAAKTNYEYGEKSAENAYKRQMEMYNKSYQDQSYSAMRKQMEDAGLSVGMMYGNSGSGGGSGSMSGAPQGATGGAVAGQASDEASRLSAGLSGARLGLDTALSMKDLKLKDAQINEINATAEAKRAEAGLSTEKKITEMQSRDVIIKATEMAGRLDWIKGIRAEYEDSEGAEKPGDRTFWDDQYGMYDIVGKSISSQGHVADILKTIGEANAAEGNAGLAKATKALRDTENQFYFKKLMIEVSKADALGVMAAAQKLNAETGKADFMHKYGIEMTPLQWAQLGIQGVGVIVNVIGAAKGFKAPMKQLETLEETVTKEFWDKHGEFKGGTTQTRKQAKN